MRDHLHLGGARRPARARRHRAELALHRRRPRRSRGGPRRRHRHGRNVHRPGRLRPRDRRGRLAQDAVDAQPRPGRRSSTRSTGADLARPRSTGHVHGTTVATNALIERTGARVLLFVTAGHEDIPYIQRINRKTLYDLRWQKPKPLLVSRRDSARRAGADRLARARSSGRSTRMQLRGGCARESAAAADRGGGHLPALLLRQPRARASR